MARILMLLGALRIEEQGGHSCLRLGGLELYAAATALDLPVGTVRSRLSRAHEHIRERLRWRHRQPASGCSRFSTPEGES